METADRQEGGTEGLRGLRENIYVLYVLRTPCFTQDLVMVSPYEEAGHAGVLSVFDGLLPWEGLLLATPITILNAHMVT